MNSENKAIQIIYKKPNSNLGINEEALNLLKEINEPVASFVIIGPYRQGKSYILSRLMGSSNGFETSNSTTSCTKGIWMLNKPVMLKDNMGNTVPTLLFDTEGLHSDDSENDWDNKLFLFSYLISSLFCYNTKNIFTTSDLDIISFITICSQRIKDSRNSNPNFIWLIRDFSLSNEENIQERLEQFLQEEEIKPTHSKQQKINIEQRNEVKENIKKSFQSINCCSLACPASDGIQGKSMEDALKSLNTIPLDELRSQFKDDLERLFDIVKKCVKLKINNNIVLNGTLFASYINDIVNKINSNDDIVFDDSMKASLTVVAERTLENVKNTYIETMSQTKYPIKWDTFNSIEQELYNNGVKKLETSVKVSQNSDICESIFKNTKERLNMFRVNEHERFRNKNKQMIISKNTEILLQNWQILQGKDENSIQNINELNDSYEKLKNIYWAQCIHGPEANEILKNFEETVFMARKAQVNYASKHNEVQKKQMELDELKKAHENQHNKIDSQLKQKQSELQTIFVELEQLRNESQQKVELIQPQKSKVNNYADIAKALRKNFCDGYEDTVKSVQKSLEKIEIPKCDAKKISNNLNTAIAQTSQETVKVVNQVSTQINSAFNEASSSVSKFFKF